MRKLKFEYKFLVVYLLLGGLWILFSDRVLNSFFSDAEVITRIQTFKGWFYVTVTAFFFYALVKKHLAKIRLAEQEAKKSDALKTAFLQNISHEIRTPMNGIIGFSDLLNQNGLPEDKKKFYIETISRSSNQLLSIVNDVLDISMIETGNIAVSQDEFYLNSALMEVYNIYAPQLKNGVAFNIELGLPDKESLVIGDEVKIKQVINNLINNAIKFTESGHISFGYLLKGSCIEFFVKDTGKGIDPGIRNIIFERFNKAQMEANRVHEGIGLGLAICKGNVEMLNGKIWYESAVDQGTIFYFSIDYKPVEASIKKSLNY
jgi:signal transduction histidine kinase